MIIGIDIGSTTTDAVALNNDKIIKTVSVKAGDSLTAAAGGLGKIVTELDIPLSKIDLVAATGVGSFNLGDKLLDLPVAKVDEFNAVGTGGAFLTGLDKAVVMSMGTGTAVVVIDNGQNRHWIGSGIGGGALLGLARMLLRIQDVDTLIEKARNGCFTNVDLTVGDITGGLAIKNLSPSVTAANFGKVDLKASEEDLALGLINMVCQAIGVIAVASARANRINEIILTGKLTALPQARTITQDIGSLFGGRFRIPENAGLATAIGAALFLRRHN